MRLKGKNLHLEQSAIVDDLFRSNDRLYSATAFVAGIILFCIGHFAMDSVYPEGFFTKLFGLAIVLISVIIFARTYFVYGPRK